MGTLPRRLLGHIQLCPAQSRTTVDEIGFAGTGTTVLRPIGAVGANEYLVHTVAIDIGGNHLLAEAIRRVITAVGSVSPWLSHQPASSSEVAVSISLCSACVSPYAKVIVNDPFFSTDSLQLWGAIAAGSRSGP